MGGNRRLLAADVYMFLQNTSQKVSTRTQLQYQLIHHISGISQPHLERLGVTGLYPKTGFSEDNLKLYLQTSPAGEYIVCREACRVSEASMSSWC